MNIKISYSYSSLVDYLIDYYNFEYTKDLFIYLLEKEYNEINYESSSNQLIIEKNIFKNKKQKRNELSEKNENIFIMTKKTNN